MKKATVFTFLIAMMAASINLNAQEVTITVQPGWNWISYPNALPMTINEALEDFAPMEGDVVKSQSGVSLFVNGRWRGSLTQFDPGRGLMYRSLRSEPVNFVFSQPLTALVETDTLTDVTEVSAVASGSVSLIENGNVILRGVCWSTESSPNIYDNHTLEGAGEGSFSSTLDGLYPNTTYYVRAYAITEYGLSYGDELSFTTLDGAGFVYHEYVDLGLPSGILWATCNVGADVPEEYGDYFAWAETQPKSIYNWNTYVYCNGTYVTLTKYCINPRYGYNGYEDLLLFLLPEDDAATANWGYGWRMPTRTEWKELYENTTQTWITQNGVNGRLFTAANGNSIFLPAAGYRHDGNHYYAGNSSFYWASNLDLSCPSNAWYFCFDSSCYYLESFYRRYGISVRPVRSSR